MTSRVSSTSENNFFPTFPKVCRKVQHGLKHLKCWFGPLWDTFVPFWALLEGCFQGTDAEDKQGVPQKWRVQEKNFQHKSCSLAKVGWSSWQDKSSSQKGWVSIDCSVVAALLSTTTRPVHKSSTGCWRVVTGCWQGVTGWYWRAVTGCWQGVTGWYWRGVTGRYKGVTGCYRGVTGCWRGVTEYWRGVTGRFFVLGLLLFFLFHNSYKKLKGNHVSQPLGHMCPNPPQPPHPLMMGGWDTCVPTQWWPTCYGL